jgi:DNA-binding response OmpR family regulator
MGGFSVLLVDNEPTTSDRIYNGLSDQGLAVRRARSQAQTLSEIEKKDIDVVLLDLMIAGTDGIALLREIKTRDPLVEVILLANQANPSVAIQGIKLGFTNCRMPIRKRPFKKKKLKRLEPISKKWIRVQGPAEAGLHV